jgi:PA14 domain
VIFKPMRLLAAGLFVFALAACASSSETPKSGPTAATPQPAAAALQPGLSVRYWPYDMNNVNEVERLARSGGGTKGAPLPGLDYKSSGGPVLSSTNTQEIGAEITGFIRFPQSGRYLVAANSNDGVRVFVGGAQIAENPGIHDMQPTPPGEITVEGGVWYPLRVLYFQRHGTWGLQLLWAQAGGTLAVVPASALARTE